MRSILTDNLKVCYICGSTENVDLHHCIHGSPENRKLATKYHIVVGLCSECHRGLNGVHGKNGRPLDLKLKSDAQEAWIRRKLAKKEVKDYHHGVQKWVEIFGEDFTHTLIKENSL